VPEISVIIVTWNGRQHLDDCLTAVAAQQGVDAETVLVDNASADGTVEYVRERFPDVRIVALDSNHGFAGGNNAGVREARGRYVAFLNNDTIADAGWLRALRAGLDEAHRIALVTSRIVYMHDPAIIDSAGDGLTRAGGAFKRLHGGPASAAEDSREVFGACGAAFMMPRAVFETVGGFDEDFFASYEDVDLSYRVRLLGYRCRYVADARVRHLGSATLGRVSSRSVFFAQRNLEWMYLKNTPTSILVRTLPRHLVYAAAAAAYFARLGLFGTFVRAKASALAGLGQVLRKRAAIQRARTASAADIWSQLEPRWLALKLREERFDRSIAKGSTVPAVAVAAPVVRERDSAGR
jgi:GT2 family glycosyltransferase